MDYTLPYLYLRNISCISIINIYIHIRGSYMKIYNILGCTVFLFFVFHFSFLFVNLPDIYTCKDFLFISSNT